LYVQYTFVTWVPSYLVEDRHLTVLKSGFATSIPWACAFLVGILAGRTSDIALRRGMSALNARKIVLVTGMVAALAILGTAFASSATVAMGRWPTPPARSWCHWSWPPEWPWSAAWLFGIRARPAA
jgi:ACS family D-galactonate transporter-like MFS transporter